MPPQDSTRERFADLAKLVESAEPGRWLILSHDNPDPDSLVSAVLLGRLLRRVWNRKVTLGYGGIVGRAENRALMESLDVKFSHLRHLSLKHYRHFCLVDAQPGTGNNQLPADATATLVFDHHPMRAATRKVPFVDIRTDYGATVTVLAEYLAAAGVPLSKRLSTGMVYALRSETQEFGREYTPADKALYDELLPQVNRRALARIQNARLPVSYFRNLSQALENLYTVDTLIISHLAEVEQPDIVPEIADLMLRMKGKTWSLATGLYGDRLYLSIRTTNPRADAGNLMRRLVGRRGGGHGMMAGGWMALGTLARAPNGDARTLQLQVAKRLAKYLKKKPERLQPLELPEGKG